MSDQNINNDNSHTKAFVKSSEKYEDLNSSGITLVFTAILGYIFMILKTLDVIPLHFEGVSIFLFYIVMGGMFTTFLVIGILSLKKARHVKAGISKEENTEADIIRYFTDNYSSQSIDDAIGAASLSEGDLYYKRYDYLKSDINSKFSDVDDSFAEHLIEEIYEKIFE